MKKYFYLAMIIVCSACNQSKEKEFLVTRVRSAAKLATMEVVLNKIVVSTLNSKKKYWFGNNQNAAVFNTEARVKFGIQLDKIRNQDVSINGDSITLRLPPVEILSFSYPHEKFKEIHPLSNFDAIRNDHTKILELDKVFRLAETDILKKIELLRLRGEAESKTTLFLEQFLNKAGYHNIIITFNKRSK